MEATVDEPVLECAACLANEETSGLNSPVGYAEMLTRRRAFDVQRLGQKSSWDQGWEDGVEGWYGQLSTHNRIHISLLMGEDYAASYLFAFIMGAYAAEHNWSTPFCKEGEDFHESFWNDKAPHDNVNEPVEPHLTDPPPRWCPYPDCGFVGTDEDVDQHRAEAHKDEPQMGSNLKHRPRY